MRVDASSCRNSPQDEDLRQEDGVDWGSSVAVSMHVIIVHKQSLGVPFESDLDLPSYCSKKLYALPSASFVCK